MSIFKKGEDEREMTLEERYRESAELLTRLMNGRVISNIPENDEYWRALKSHRIIYNQLEEVKKY